MRLSKLLKVAGLQSTTWVDPEVEYITSDSRQVRPNTLFVAVAGARHDGHEFVMEAASRGAEAAVVEKPVDATLPLVLVPNTRIAFSRLSAAIHGFPARQLITIGVTGTDGKSTTCLLIAHLLEKAGIPSGAITTVGVWLRGKLSPNPGRQTTPEACEIHSILADMQRTGIQAAVIESTSHGLAQHRVADCDFTIGVFTNVTHEHLDYHGSLEQYRRDKARLIELVNASTKGSTRAVVLNRDDPTFPYYLGWALAPVISYSRNGNATVSAHIIASDIRGTLIDLHYGDERAQVHLALPGTYNVDNALAAASVAFALRVPLSAIGHSFKTAPSVPGRMQLVNQGQPFTVIVDYAHTPEAFRRILPMARSLAKGRMICVFGSAGERDKLKRAIQGEIAGTYCDIVVLTDEDPRTEDRWQIIHEIASGVERAGKAKGNGLLMVPDRREAIATALGLAQEDDVVLLLGKGHETSIEYANGSEPWNEVEVVSAFLREMGYNEGPFSP